MSVAVDLFFAGLQKTGKILAQAPGKLWDALEHPVAMGSQELGVALLGKHDGFVLYPEGMPPPKAVEGPQLWKEVEAETPEKTPPEQGRGGREM